MEGWRIDGPQTQAPPARHSVAQASTQATPKKESKFEYRS